MRIIWFFMNEGPCGKSFEHDPSTARLRAWPRKCEMSAQGRTAVLEQLRKHADVLFLPGLCALMHAKKQHHYIKTFATGRQQSTQVCGQAAQNEKQARLPIQTQPSPKQNASYAGKGPARGHSYVMSCLIGC